MTWESDSSVDVQDRTKYIWLGIGIAVVLILVAFAVLLRPSENISRVRVRHILVKCDVNDPIERGAALEEIEKLRQRIEAGESFAKLAKQYSGDPGSASRGGDLGYHKRGVFDPAFEEYVWSAPVGELSEPIKTEYGFHLVEVMDRFVSEADKVREEQRRKARELLEERRMRVLEGLEEEPVGDEEEFGPGDEEPAAEEGE